MKELEQEPWSPVSIGVDVTEAGAHVIGIYAMSDDTSQIFYAKFYPVPQRTWVGLTDDELPPLVGDNGKYMELQQVRRFYKAIEAKLKSKNNADY